MSTNNSKRMKRERREELRRLKALAVKRNITMFTLIFVLFVGLVSTTFATFVPQQTENTGTLVAEIRTAAVNQGHKEQIADTKANVDVATTSVDITGGEVFYLKPNSNWNQASARFAIYFFNNDTGKNTWVSMTAVSDDTGVYQATAPSGTWKNLVFCRMNPSNTTNSWDNKWNQSGDLTYNGTNDLFTVPSGSWNSATTTWSKYAPPASFNVGDIIYFDIRSNPAWRTADASSLMYVQFNDSISGSTSSSDRAQMTRIGENLYAYKFTSKLTSTIRFWRGNSSYMWNYSNTLIPGAGNNGVYLNSSSGWNGNGTRAAFTFTSITAPTLTANPTELVVGNTTTLTSTTDFTINYSRGGTSYDSVAQADGLTYTFKNGSTTIKTANSSNTYTWTPAVGTHSVNVTVSCPLAGLSSTSSNVSVKVKDIFNYTVRINCGGTVTPESGKASSFTLTVTANDGYEFDSFEYNNTEATITNKTTNDNVTTATVELNADAEIKVNLRPLEPTSVTLTGNNFIEGKGTGTQNDPYIVYSNSGFTFTAETKGVPNSAVAHYSTLADSGYADSNVFNPELGNKGSQIGFTVYAKAYAGEKYSAKSVNATAYYMSFTYLDGANTGFNISNQHIYNDESIDLSNANLTDTSVSDDEKNYIKHKYQVKKPGQSAFEDVADYGETNITWSPETIGTYSFRIETFNEKTGQVVYSPEQTVIVKQRDVHYDITVTNKGSVEGNVTLSSNSDDVFQDNAILAGNPLYITINRPSTKGDYYFKYLKVDGVNVKTNVNSDITTYEVSSKVLGPISVEYEIALKPLIKVKLPTNAQSITFKYDYEGQEKTVSVEGDYYVDYSGDIVYTVTPKTGYYVTSMTGVTIGTISSGAVSGTKENVDANIDSVTASVTSNNTVTVSIDKKYSDIATGASMKIGNDDLAFDVAKPLTYGHEYEIVVTPPEGYYAVVQGNDVNATIATDGKATFKVMLTGSDKNYTVKLLKCPKIYMVQPQYGSVYVTDSTGMYYFDGDTVGYGTTLTVHTKPDHSSATIEGVLVNGTSIGNTDGLTFDIVENSTVTATITVDSDHIFANGTEYGTRRIFFTDNAGWGNGNVRVHYSNTKDDINFSDGNTMLMTYKYTNKINQGQGVYYADIPYKFKYVNFYKNSSSYTASALIDNTANAFYHNNGSSPSAIHTWNEVYSDYVATDRETSIQQGRTVKNEAAIFQYACDFGDDALIAELVEGNDIKFDFDKGVLYITPTENTYNFSLVKVKSTASKTEKYYLIKVENFEIVSFSGLRKIYSTAVMNSLQLELIVKGGSGSYTANYFVSDTNLKNSFGESISSSTTFSETDSLEEYINSFFIQYQFRGVKYFKVEASDNSGNKATAMLKTLFGTADYKGKNVIYFHNNSGFDISKYNLRACFMDSDGSNKTFVTMQQVDGTYYYRAVVPVNADGKVDFYLCNKNTFSNNYADFDGTNDSEEIYSYAVRGLSVPTIGTNVDILNDNYSRIVYQVNSIDDGIISGDFTDFN